MFDLKGRFAVDQATTHDCFFTYFCDSRVIKRIQTQLYTMVPWVRMLGVAVQRMAGLEAVIIPSLNLPIGVYQPW